MVFIRKLMRMRSRVEHIKNKELLQQLMDCAMACQECIVAGTHQNSAAGALIGTSSKNASDECFKLAKSMVDAGETDHELFLACERACRIVADHCSKYGIDNLHRKCSAISEQCADACRAAFLRASAW